MRTTRLFLGLLLTVISMAVDAQQLAFPEAQGWGRFATGGRTGKVYHVTNLNDSGTGSLRDAVSQPNRIVVFDVSGVIRISSRLVFKSNITVAGQTAPGEGITVYGDGMSCSGASNVIIRYMRFRMGAVGTKDADCGGLANGGNIIFDHCSFAWGQDENFSINWDNKGTAPHDITIQNSIVGQGLMQHSAGGLIQADNITMYRVLLCDNKTRNFKVKGKHQYVNNIVYNWSTYAYEMGGESAGESFANVVGNLFINGNSTSTSADGLSGGNSGFHFYGSDNWQDRNKDGVYNPELFTGNGGSDRKSQPYDYPELQTWSGKDLVEKLLPDVGASLPYRDLADCYMIDEVHSFGTEGKLITNENELPIGVPTAWPWFKGTKPTDTDGDGMPDEWEVDNATDPAVDDAMVLRDNGYTNIENYINSITIDDRQFFLRQPMLLSLQSATTNSLTLQWADYSDNEDGFIVEMQQNGTFAEVGRTKSATFTIADESLQPGKPYVVRVCAYKGNDKSNYTPELTVKTRPEQVDIIDCATFTGEGDGEWLIAPTEDETITLTEAMEKTAVVVRSDANVTINGTGYISGSASMNKTGNGTLTIASNQQYEGPTVLHQGIFDFKTLKNGGIASGLGKSQEFAQNWVMDGGVYRYSGYTTSTNRSAQLYSDTGFDIATKTAVVTMNGSIEGQGNLIISGEGTMSVNTPSFFKYDGDLRIEGGTVKLASKDVSDAGIGSASQLVMAGGKFVTVGKNEATVTYNFPIVAEAGTTSTVDFDLWNTNKCRVSGTGTLIWNVHYLREYIEGNWDNFTGQLIVTGTGKAGQSQFAIRNNVGIKNATLYLKGNAQVNGAKNESTYYLGGLSGDSGTKLSGFNVKAKGTGTWIVGGANTDETFRGVIDNNDQAGSHPGTTSIQKQGTGDWRLTGNNVYSGTTTVGGGALIVNGTHSGTGAITVRTGATLAGTGQVAAATTINTGGFLQAGDTLVNERGLTFNGTLKLNGTSTLVVLADRTKSNTITLKGATTISTTATLRIDFDEAPYDKTVYQVFKLSSGTISGKFKQILPETPGEGQTWDTSELYTNGIIKVVGGEKNPDDQSQVDPQPAYETLTALLAWGNMINKSYDNSSYNNMMVGAENDEAYGFSLVCIGNLQKSYSSAGTPKLKIPYNGEILERTAIKCSNGAQNAIFMPEGAKATKLTIYSITGSNASNRVSYWKEVAGKTYTESTATILDLDAPRDNPNAVTFTLDNVRDSVTFTNTGEQQCVILYLEYHYGDDGVKGDVNGDGTVDVADIASIIDIMAGATVPDASPSGAADVNGDGTVDVADIAAVIDIMAANARRAEAMAHKE